MDHAHGMIGAGPSCAGVLNGHHIPGPSREDPEFSTRTPAGRVPHAGESCGGKVGLRASYAGQWPMNLALPPHAAYKPLPCFLKGETDGCRYFTGNRNEFSALFFIKGISVILSPRYG